MWVDTTVPYPCLERDAVCGSVRILPTPQSWCCTGGPGKGAGTGDAVIGFELRWNGVSQFLTGPPAVQSYTAVVERCPDTGLYVGYVPGFPGAHSQGESLEELNDNLKEVIAMILEEGVPPMVGELVGTQFVMVS